MKREDLTLVARLDSLIATVARDVGRLSPQGSGDYIAAVLDSRSALTQARCYADQARSADTAARVSRYSYEVAHAEKARLYAVEVATLYAHRAQSAVRLADLLSRGVSS